VWREGVYQLPDQTQARWKLGDISILGGGSAGSSDVEGKRNFINLATMSGDGIKLNILRSQGGDAFQLMSTWDAKFALRDGRLYLDDWLDSK